MEDSIDVDRSPLRIQNDLFSCGLHTGKDHSKVGNDDENDHQ